MKKMIILSLAILLQIQNLAFASMDVANSRQPEFIPGHYIVTLKDSARNNATQLAKNYGLSLGHVYAHALNGFSAVVPDNKLAALTADPSIRSIEQDMIVYATAKPDKPGGKPGGGGSEPPSLQVLPTGIDRANADSSLTAAIDGIDTELNVDIAIIDTGVDLRHPDLNVVNDVNFTSNKNGNDDHGHGTHVAGTVAARDNELGVVGIAPGARIWAVKVLDRRGQGFLSNVIAGIDYVTAHASEIEVANMSLGGSGNDGSSSYHTAIINSVNAGVTYVVAAGNETDDAANHIPAAFDEVITVSAIADSDGQSGGLGSNTSYGADDSFASFSNYGADVDIAAPGVNIYSTWKGQSYNAISGTSMASPHVAGAAALYLVNNPAASPAQVKTALINAASVGSFTGDTDGFAEPLLNVGSL
ncbi:MAG: S8 family serine peptidase [Cyanobacteria bacterium]|nr:S8 family serine peptidase [Cyanobacteriota bacterium]MDA1020215.1 S8 family serine peptidase [Cyanobacteriota bacterium]